MDYLMALKVIRLETHFGHHECIMCTVIDNECMTVTEYVKEIHYSMPVSCSPYEQNTSGKCSSVFVSQF